MMKRICCMCKRELRDDEGDYGNWDYYGTLCKPCNKAAELKEERDFWDDDEG